MALPGITAGPRRWLFVRLLVNGLSQAVVAFATAWLIRLGFDAARNGSTTGEGFPITIAGGLLLAGIVILGLRVAERIDAERLGQDYISKARIRLFDQIAAVPWRRRTLKRFGLTLTRLVSDLNALKNWVSSGVARLTVAPVSLTGGLIALAMLSPRCAAATLIALTSCAACGLALTPALRARMREARRRRGHLAGNLGEKTFAVSTIKHHGRSGSERDRLKKQSRRLARAMVDRVRISGLLRSLPDAAFPLTAAGVFAVASFELAAGRMTLGGLTGSVFVLGMMMGALRDVARAWDYRLAYEQARRRLDDIFACPQIGNAKDATDLKGFGPVSVAFEGVTVEGALHEVTAAAEAADVVLIVGQSGAGKSTLLALAARMFDPQRGVVLLNVQPAHKLTLESLQRWVRLVSPDLPLLRGSVADNIRFGAEDPDELDFEPLCALCGLDLASGILPNGLDSMVDERGQNLPEGLRARIALARALAANPRLLLIDDPVFSTDDDARAALQRVLQRARATILIAAPWGEHLAGVNRIWLLDSGRLIEETDHFFRNERMIAAPPSSSVSEIS